MQKLKGKSLFCTERMVEKIMENVIGDINLLKRMLKKGTLTKLSWFLDLDLHTLILYIKSDYFLTWMSCTQVFLIIRKYLHWLMLIVRMLICFLITSECGIHLPKGILNVSSWLTCVNTKNKKKKINLIIWFSNQRILTS